MGCVAVVAVVVPAAAAAAAAVAVVVVLVVMVVVRVIVVHTVAWSRVRRALGVFVVHLKVWVGLVAAADYIAARRLDLLPVAAWATAAAVVVQVARARTHTRAQTH